MDDNLEVVIKEWNELEQKEIDELNKNHKREWGSLPMCSSQHQIMKKVLSNPDKEFLLPRDPDW